jgi:hypothetical protein
MEVAFEGLHSSTLVGSQTALAQRHIRKMPQSLWEEGWFPSPLIGTHGDDLRGVLKPSMVGYVPSPSPPGGQNSLPYFSIHPWVVFHTTGRKFDQNPQEKGLVLLAPYVLRDGISWANQ